MRKLMYILIGLVMVLIAISLAGYRHVYEPRTRVARDTYSSSRSIDRARPEAATRAPQTTRSAPTSGTSSGGASATSIANFATVIDVLNVVVGIVGIVLALMGMRMQRQAMAMQSARVNERR